MVEPSESLSGCVIGASTGEAAAGVAAASGASPNARAPLTSKVPVTADHRRAAKIALTSRLTLLSQPVAELNRRVG